MGSMACRRCGSKEHSTGDCPHGFFSTACAKCGSLDHASSDCPHGIFSAKCSRCGSKEHATGDCPHGVFSTACAKCGSLEHASGDCPHGIFSSKCSRCGSRKHATDDCPQGLFPTRSPVSEPQQTTSAQSDDSGCAKVIGALIGIAILVAVVVWLLFNVVLPLVLLNSALIFTILALGVKDHKPVFASLTFAGAAYMLFDISNGWLSANFVNNVVKTPEWLTAFVYINAAALGVSAWILARPLFRKAAAAGALSQRNGVLLSIAAGALVGAPMVLLPVIHHVVGIPFLNRSVATSMSGTTSATTPGAAPISASATPASPVTTRDVSSLSKVSPEPTEAVFIGKWQLVEGELHPVTGQIVKSFLTIAGTPDTPTVVWTSELDGSVDHTINLKYTRGSLIGDYYGGKGNVAIEMLSDGRLSFTIDPYAEFAPIKNSIYAKALDTTSPAGAKTIPAVTNGPTERSLGTTVDEPLSTARLQEFVLDYLAAVSSASADTIAEYYGQNVNYFGKGMVTKDFVHADKQAYFRRWPKVTQHLVGEVNIIDTGVLASKQLNFLSDYQVENPERQAHSQGTVDNSLIVAVVDGNIRIVGQTETVTPQRR